MTKRRFPLYQQILAGMLVGALTGWLLGPRAAPLGDLGKIVIQLIKTLAAPLLFFAVVDAFVRTNVRARAAAAMVGISLTNALIALSLGLALSNWLKPGASIKAAPAAPLASVEKIDFTKTITGYIPTSIMQPFAENSVISIILLAVLIGLALRRVKNETGARIIDEGAAVALRTFEVILAWIVRLVPIAVFGVVAKTIGQDGFAPFKGLAAYVGVALLGLALHILVVYQAWLVFVAKVSLRAFWAGSRDAIVYALGASSSLATLPVTLNCLSRMKVSPEAARLAACVGTNLNNDGIILYEGMAVLFVAQAHGIDLTMGQQLLAAASCLLAGIGIAGVPDAGLISLSLVLATVGLPTELLPLLLTVDWVLSRARATTNVISDITVAVVLNKVDKKAGSPRA